MPMVPLLLLACTSGGGLLAEKLAVSQVDAKEKLIVSRTEGMGEDKDISLLAAPILAKPAPVFAANPPTILITSAENMNTVSSVRTANMLTASSVRTGNLNTDSSMRGTLRGGSEYVRSSTCWRYETESLSASRLVEEALPFEFFAEYYAQKTGCATEALDSLRVFEYEGEDCAAGSVGCICESEVDESLDFLDGLDSKFATLAEICKHKDTVMKVTSDSSANAMKISPPSLVEEVHVKNVRMEEVKMEQVDTKKIRAEEVNTEKINVVVSPTTPRRVVHEQVVVQNQAYVIPQPVFYEAAPVIQTQYMVRPAVLVPDNRQSLYMVGCAPVTENVVMQESRVVAGPPMHLNLSGQKNVMILENQVLHGSLLQTSEQNGAESITFVRKGEQDVVNRGENVVVGGPAVPGEMIGVQQGTLNRGKKVVLVERQVGSGQVVHEGVAGRHQGLVLVEGQVGAGQVLQGGQSWIQQGTLPRGSLSASQKILLVEKEGAAGKSMGSPVSQQISLGSQTGLPQGSVKMTSHENAFVFESHVKSRHGTMRLDSDSAFNMDSAV